MPPRSSSRNNTPAPARATPARTTRASSKEPRHLPAISTKTSHAYGAPGKANLGSQIGKSTTTLTDVFANRPSKVPTVDEEDEEIETKQDNNEQTEEEPPEMGRQQSQQSHLSDITTASQPRDPTQLDTRAGYQARRQMAEVSLRAGLRNSAVPSEHSSIRSTSRQPTPARSNEHEPSPVRVFQRTFPRFIQEVTMEMYQKVRCSYRKFQPSIPSAGNLFFLLSLGLLILLTVFASTQRPEIFPTGVIPRLRNPFRRSEQWEAVPSDLEQQWLYFKQRIENVEKRMDALTGDNSLHDQTKALLEDILPQQMVLKEKDGSWEISDELWQALAARLSQDTTENSRIWDAFVERNQLRLSGLQEGTSSEALLKDLNDRHIVSRQLLIEELDKKYITIQKQFSAKLSEVETKMLKEAKRIAEKTSTELIERSPANRNARLQAGTLAYSNILINSGNALKDINFFSIGLGAGINPKLSSPTAQRSNIFADAYRWTAGISGPNPPISALQTWQEATDCWCAAPTDKGQAQLAVEMQHRVYPHRIVVEHVPHTGTLNIAAAPRDLEFWIETSSPSHAMRIQQAIKETVPAAYWDECKDAPSDRHVCIGKGQYDIHGDNYVQTFETFVDAEALGLAVDKAIVRVTTNWGASHTCLYRIRLNGKRLVPGRQ